MCLNPRCRTEFHSFDHANPPCPKCGNLRVSWVPGGGHIAKRSPSLDRTVRSLADSFGLTDLNSPSPSRLNRAMPRIARPAESTKLGTKHFAPGFSADVYANRATAEWSQAPVNLRATTQRVGPHAIQFSGGDGSVPNPLQSPGQVVVHARHRPDRGRAAL